MNPTVAIRTLRSLALAALLVSAPRVGRAEEAGTRADVGRTVRVGSAAAAGKGASGAIAPGEAAPAELAAEAQAALEGTLPTLSSLQVRYNPMLHQGLLGMRVSSTLSGGALSGGASSQQLIMGDNTDPWGMSWTKCTNLGIHLMATLVAEQRGLLQEQEGKEQIRSVLDILRSLRGHRGIFPENILLKDGIAGEVVNGRARFSSIDSAWVTMALSLVEARYKGSAEGLGRDAAALIARQDYRAFVGDDGMLGAGFYVDVQTDRKVEDIAFAYSDRNSEARPLLLALVGMGQLPATAWERTYYRWGSREGLALAKSWHFSAFVEMTGALFFDEAKLAPRSLGKSHEGYIEASVRVAQRNGHRMWGYAPACDAQNAYAEFGLDRPDSVSPYAAGLLTLTGDPRALQNMGEILASMPQDGRALPDGLDPLTGNVSCGVARSLDQGLLFLALNADAVRALVRKTSWYASAERRLKAMDRKFPMRKPPTSPNIGEPLSFLSERFLSEGFLSEGFLSEGFLSDQGFFSDQGFSSDQGFLSWQPLDANELGARWFARASDG